MILLISLPLRIGRWIRWTIFVYRKCSYIVCQSVKFLFCTHPCQYVDASQTTSCPSMQCMTTPCMRVFDFCNTSSANTAPRPFLCTFLALHASRNINAGRPGNYFSGMANCALGTTADWQLILLVQIFCLYTCC